MITSQSTQIIGTDIGSSIPSDENLTNYSMEDYKQLLATGMISPETFQKIVGASGGIGSIPPSAPTSNPNITGAVASITSKMLGTPDTEEPETLWDGGMVKGYADGGTVTDPSMEQNVTYAPSTQDAQIASGANTIPGAQPATAGLSATDFIPGYGVAKDIAGGLADQANQQTFQTTGQTTSGELNPNYSSSYLNSYAQQAPATEAAQQANLQAAGTQAAVGAPAYQQSAAVQKQLADSYQQNQIEIAQAGRDFARNAQLADNSMNAAIATAQTNPRSDVWNDLSVNHPIATTIALVLGGIGGALTGQPNAAMSVINNRIQDAVDQRADTIKQQYEQSLQYRGFAQDALTNLDKTILARSSAAIIANNGAMGYTNMVQGQINSQTAPQQAANLNNVLQQNVVKAESQLQEWTKQQIASGNTDKLNAAGFFLNQATGVFEKKPGQGAPGYSPVPRSQPVTIPSTSSEPIRIYGPSAGGGLEQKSTFLDALSKRGSQ